MSFYLDGWMLIALGVFVAILSRTFYKEDSFLKYTLSIMVLVVFYMLSIGLFCELNAEEHGFLGALNEFFFGFVKDMYPGYYENHPDATSCEFMFSSAEEWIKDGNSGDLNGLGAFFGGLFNTEVPFESLEEMITGGHQLYLFFGIFMFCCYPAFLYIGTQIGFLLFGRKPGDKGVIGLL